MTATKTLAVRLLHAASIPGARLGDALVVRPLTPARTGRRPCCGGTWDTYSCPGCE